MAFRDGILVFCQPGALPAAALEQLIQAVRDLNMNEVREELARQQAEGAPPTSYGISVTLDVPFADAVSRVRAAMQERGFAVLTEIDVTATLRAKLGEQIEDYIILGACNPPAAHRALGIDRSIGLLLLCNVVIRAAEAGTVGTCCTAGRTAPASRSSAAAPPRGWLSSRSGSATRPGTCTTTSSSRC